jgi:hypothetical protein
VEVTGVQGADPFEAAVRALMAHRSWKPRPPYAVRDDLWRSRLQAAWVLCKTLEARVGGLEPESVQEPQALSVLDPGLVGTRSADLTRKRFFEDRREAEHRRLASASETSMLDGKADPMQPSAYGSSYAPRPDTLAEAIEAPGQPAKPFSKLDGRRADNDFGPLTPADWDTAREALVTGTKSNLFGTSKQALDEAVEKMKRLLSGDPAA